MILGNDTLVAARPSTPAQVANACIAAGFDLVVPPTWADELVATAYLERLAGRREPVIVACACPRVATLIERAGTTLPQLALAAPPVAVARALRAVHGDAILITYVGACPSASDPSIDVRFSPSALFAQLDRQEVKIAEQPTALAAGHDDRWRRYSSVPGGLPALRFLARPPVDRVLRTLDAGSFARGEVPPSRSDVLVDLAGAAQCECGGARDEIEDGEPRRSTTPVVQCPLGLPLDPEPTPRRRRPVFLRGPTRPDGADAGAAGAADSGAGGESSHVGAPGSDHSAASRTPASRSPSPSRKGARVLDEAPPSLALTASESVPARARGRALALVPALVLVLAAALGVAVYAAGVSSAGPVVRDSSAVTGATSEGERSGPDGGGAATSPAPNDSEPDDRALGTGRTVPDSATRVADDGIARNDSVRPAARRRPRRAPAPAVVPGWMPQGRPAFVPGDSSTAPSDSRATPARPDSTRPDSTRLPA